MSRISRPQLFMEIAHITSRRSTCFRLNVGAVIVVNNRVVSIGYNGAPPGAPHCQGQNCPGKFACNETIHAEVNAITYLPSSCAIEPKHLYVTHSPCQECAELIYKENIEKVFFDTPYRITEPLYWLINRNVEVYQVTPSGYVIDYHSRDLVNDD